MINPVIPIKPIIPSIRKKFSLTPETNNRAIMVTTMIKPVPKSGWSIIRPKVKRTTHKIGRTEVLIFLILLLVKYLEVKIMIPSLVNSLGWIPKEPIPNQLLEPFLTVPMPGIRTNIKRIIQMSKIMLLYL